MSLIHVHQEIERCLRARAGAAEAQVAQLQARVAELEASLRRIVAYEANADRQFVSDWEIYQSIAVEIKNIARAALQQEPSELPEIARR